MDFSKGHLFSNKNFSSYQGWGAGAKAGRSRVFLAPWSRSRLKKNQEPEPEPEPEPKPKPLGKKSGAGAAKKKLRED